MPSGAAGAGADVGLGVVGTGAGTVAVFGAGANLAGALDVARRAQDAVVVVIFCDGGEKYLSERFWDQTGEGAPAGGRG